MTQTTSSSGPAYLSLQLNRNQYIKYDLYSELLKNKMRQFFSGQVVPVGWSVIPYTKRLWVLSLGQAQT